MSRLTVYGAFLLPDKCILCGKPATITHGHAPAVSLDTLQSSGGSFAFRSIDMSARNGKPCKKCGGLNGIRTGIVFYVPGRVAAKGPLLTQRKTTRVAESGALLTREK